MQIPILVESVPGVGYRASGLGVEAEGASSQDPIEKLREEVEHRVAAGGQLASIELPATEHPLARWAGDLKDDPLFDEWVSAMQEYRRQVDAEPGISSMAQSW